MFITLSPDRTSASIARFYQNEIVNFAVYILFYSNLRFPPFDKHGRPKYLEHMDIESVDINRESWDAWLNRIVRSQLMSLLAAENRDYSDESLVNSTLFCLPLTIDGNPGFEPTLYELYRNVANEVRNELGELEVFDNPIEYWQGSNETKQVLHKLWNRFRVDPFNRVHFVDDLSRANSIDIYKNINETLRNELGEAKLFLPFYFVQYREPVCYISESSIILGLKDTISPDSFISLIGQAIRDYVRGNRLYSLDPMFA